MDSQLITESVSNILPIAREYGLSAYDAAYLDVAVRHGVPLATLDSALQKAGRKAGIEIFKGNVTRVCACRLWDHIEFLLDRCIREGKTSETDESERARNARGKREFPVILKSPARCTPGSLFYAQSLCQLISACRFSQRE